MQNIASKIYRFYRDGFAGMTVGRSLWLLIIIKVAIIFLVLRLFFFPDIVSNESDRMNRPADAVVRDVMLERSIGEQ